MNFLTSADIQLLEDVLRQAHSAPTGDLPEIIGALARANAVALSRLQSPTAVPQADELLDVTTAADGWVSVRIFFTSTNSRSKKGWDVGGCTPAPAWRRTSTTTVNN